MSLGKSKPISLNGKSKAGYLDIKRSERSSMFFKRGRKLEYVKAGALFRRERQDHMIETAKVLAVSADCFGIPHVRYELKMEKPTMAYSEVHGPRVLALNAFADIYQERIPH
ncbi:MAG: hypothetical protein R3261_01820 [Alphaproteobacteria bacterium]|nr:hypothetical protein [Alphaproteobacteria bacterium]